MTLAVKNLCKKYGDKEVVKNLSFQMDHPGVYALLGTNGAGKTTSIRMMLGMLARDGGEVLWKGKELDSFSVNIGYLAEERGLYPKISLMDQLEYFGKLKGVSKHDIKARIAYWAKRLELEEYLYVPKVKGKKGKPKTADQLSKGNQQKIQLLVALLSDPEILVFDEPLSGLDPVNADLFKSIIREEIDRGKYMIMSSHQMATIEEFCEDITILARGETVLQGNLNEIKKGYGRVKLFLKVEGEVEGIIDSLGLVIEEKTPEGYYIRVEKESQGKVLLERLMAAEIPVICYELREPSLHEIFVEKVGGVE